MTFFILGSHPNLSEAEITAITGKNEIIGKSKQVLLFENDPINLQALQDRLAGTVKIGRIIGQMKEWNHTEAEALISAYITGAGGSDKIFFGISVYELGKASEKLEQKIQKLGINIKKELKKTGRPVRFVSSKEPQLSSVIVRQNNLLSSGGEFVLFTHKDGVYIGQTETVQDFKSWSKRDYGRPARDAKSGMLPPKLARMMINLSGIEPTGSIILDPFCGCGTVLMEATLLGFEKLIGSDISDKAIDDTTKNITWLTDQFGLQPPSLTLYTSKAQELDSVLKGTVDLIVTETYLGAPRLKALNEKEFDRTQKELFTLYEPSFITMSKLLKTNGRIVIAVPAFKVGSGLKQLGIEPLFTKIGLNIMQQFIYKRPDQIVAREIFVLSKV